MTMVSHSQHRLKRADNQTIGHTRKVLYVRSRLTPQTVRNALKEDDFCAVVKKKRPLLKKVHRLECLKFARYHKNWTVEDWKRILWSDETKINRIGSDGRTYTWKKRGGTTF